MNEARTLAEFVSGGRPEFMFGPLNIADCDGARASARHFQLRPGSGDFLLPPLLIEQSRCHQRLADALDFRCWQLHQRRAHHGARQPA